MFGAGPRRSFALHVDFDEALSSRGENPVNVSVEDFL